jgi:hypothetical protein
MRYLAIPAVLFLAACQHIDTGQADYRIAEMPTPGIWQSQVTKCTATLAAPGSCTPIDPAPVHRKYVPAGEGFSIGEGYSIELEQGVIGTQLLESVIFEHEFGKVGQFAILANAFEFAGTDAEKATKRFLEATEYGGTKDTTDDVELKLVYYGDDVRRLQPFNFSHVPVLARSKYGGRSIGIQIVILELDTQSGPVKSLLETLAKFGEQALPGPSALKSMVFDLGESLLNGGSQDDRLLDYRFVLSAAEIGQAKLGPTFVPGRYVIRRSRDRGTPMNWNDLILDHNSGRLYRFEGGERKEVRDELYLVLNIKRYSDTTDPEFYAGMDVSAFRQTVQAAADDRDKPLSAITKNLGKLVVEQRSSQLRSQLASRWTAVTQNIELLSSRSFDNLDDKPENEVVWNGCKAMQGRLLTLRDISDRNLQDAVRKFVTDYQAALVERKVDEKSEDTRPDINVEDRETLVSLISRSFMPWSGSTTPDSFASASGFEATFIKSGPAALTAEATGTAKKRGNGPGGCDDPTAKNLAGVA